MSVSEIELVDGCQEYETVEEVVTHDYIYASGKLLRETITTTVNGVVTDTDILDFYYDQNGRPYSFTYNGAEYYYILNLQGDVVEIYNDSGEDVGYYLYNAWGEITAQSGTIADINPIRYRGYYYDTELEMYYLQSRYYDPVICRFINSDAYASTGQGFLGHNMFAYCTNNPVNLLDSTGEESFWYYVVMTSDWGLAHRLVQLHIFMNNANVHTEIILAGFGRADIVDNETGRVWEVKHRGKFPLGRALEAYAQAEGYIGGTSKKVTITGLGAARAFSGSFCIKIANTSYVISYNTPMSGVVLYSVTELEGYQGEYFKEYVYNEVTQKLEECNYSTGKGFAPVIIPIGVSVGRSANMGSSFPFYPRTKLCTI